MLRSFKCIKISQPEQTPGVETLSKVCVWTNNNLLGVSGPRFTFASKMVQCLNEYQILDRIEYPNIIRKNNLIKLNNSDPII